MKLLTTLKPTTRTERAVDRKTCKQFNPSSQLGSCAFNLDGYPGARFSKQRKCCHCSEVEANAKKHSNQADDAEFINHGLRCNFLTRERNSNCSVAHVMIAYQRCNNRCALDELMRSLSGQEPLLSFTTNAVPVSSFESFFLRITAPFRCCPLSVVIPRPDLTDTRGRPGTVVPNRLAPSAFRSVGMLPSVAATPVE